MFVNMIEEIDSEDVFLSKVGQVRTVTVTWSLVSYLQACGVFRKGKEVLSAVVGIRHAAGRALSSHRLHNAGGSLLQLDSAYRDSEVEGPADIGSRHRHLRSRASLRT